MAGSFDSDGHLDPARGLIVLCVGKKESGKSVMALALAQGYPYDIVVLDVAGDDGPMAGAGASGSHDVIEWRGTVDTLPASWPEAQRRTGPDGRTPRPMILRYVPDPGSPTYLEDMDHLVGIAMTHRRCMILWHEANVAIESGRVPAHTRRFLRFNRHHQVTGVLCGPRTITMDRLALGQADLIYVFELNVPEDRKRIAGEIGWDPADFDAAVKDLGPHEYLLYDARLPKPAEGEPDLRLVHYPALPPEYVRRVERWARGNNPARLREGADR
jgi:hypothetical protein